MRLAHAEHVADLLLVPVRAGREHLDQLPQLRHLLGVGHEVEEILVRDELLDQVEDRLLDGRAGDVLEPTLLGDVLVRVIATANDHRD